MITNAELAAMQDCGVTIKFSDGTLGKCRRVSRLIYEVEELQKHLAAEMIVTEEFRKEADGWKAEADKQLCKAEELRAALKRIVSAWDELGVRLDLEDAINASRAALGEGS
jgi:uncharacterized coiled-coil DUF342 family protein